MNTRKRAAALSVVLLLGALAAFGEPAPARRFANPLLSDVVQMSRVGLSDSTIVAYVKARRARLDQDVNAQDLIGLKEAGVSEAVVSYIAGVEGIDFSPSPRRSQGEIVSRSRDAGTVAMEPPDGEDEAYAYAYPYSYDWYGYPYWYSYSPYFSTGFFVSGGRFHRRGTDHHRGTGRGQHVSGGQSSGGHSSRGQSTSSHSGSRGSSGHGSSAGRGRH